jgi:hypothetical protein
MPVNFPNIKPTARSYKPGKYPQTFFQSINGATSVVQFGAQEFNAELTLQFSNINDSDASQIIGTYETVNSRWDYVQFVSGALDCTGSSMKIRMREGTLKWRFAEPPQVTYKFRNICDVSCSFIAYLDGT